MILSLYIISDWNVTMFLLSTSMLYLLFTASLQLLVHSQKESSLKALPSIEDLCPKQCLCGSSSPVSLTIDCVDRATGENSPNSLLQEINCMLASVKDLQTFAIIRSPLTEVPLEICNQTSLVSITLVRNQIAALPDGCFVRMTNLNTFNVSVNRIKKLQVRFYYLT